MRLLVCGGRHYGDDPVEFERGIELLELIHSRLPIALLVNGGASGADYLASRWALVHKVPCVMEKARWDTEGIAAGPLRNQRMLDLYKPDALLAFPGGKGTQDMIRRAKERLGWVWEV